MGKGTSFFRRLGLLLNPQFFPAMIALAMICEAGFGQAAATQRDCKCMPRTKVCLHKTSEGSAAIVTGAKFERLLTNACTRGDSELGCTEYYTIQLYSFEKMRLLRGLEDFDQTTKFAASYEYSLANPQNWGGIYLEKEKRYTIYFRDDVTWKGYPVITSACELGKE